MTRTERVARAIEETARLQRELDITNADHIALWLEANTILDEPMSQCISWLACRIVEAHEAALTAIDEERDALFNAIKHGDADHQAWLKEAIDAHFAGQPVPEPRGKGRKEAERDALREALLPVSDWAEKHEELLKWTGSAFLAGEDVGGAKEELRHKGELHGFLCSLLGYISTAEEAARSLSSVAALEPECITVNREPDER